MLKDRIKLVRTALKISSAKKFAEELEIEEYKIKDIESGKTKSLKPSLAEKIEEKFNINGWWVLTGKGGMFLKNEINPPQNLICLTSEQNKVNHTLEVDHLIPFDYYPDVLASAGYGADNGDAVKASKVYLDKSFVSTVLSLDVSKNLDIVGVMGDSMEPFVKDGEQVIVHRTNVASDNQVVIANIKGAIYVKRLLKDPFGNWVKLISDNDNYPPITIEGEDLNYLTIIGVVKAKIKLF